MKLKHKIELVYLKILNYINMKKDFVVPALFFAGIVGIMYIGVKQGWFKGYPM